MKEISGRKLRASGILIGTRRLDAGKKNVRDMHAIVI